MLIEIRDRASSLVAYVIIGLLILSFALWGIQEYFGAGGAPAAAAVNDVEITVPEFSNRFQQYRQQLRSNLGRTYEQQFPDESVIKQQVIEGMVDMEILRQEVTEAGFRISDTSLVQKIQQVPQFRKDGKFDPELYTRLLQAQRYDKARFEAELREQEKLEQFELSLASSSFMTQADLQRFQQLFEQSRDFSYVLVQINPDSIEVSDEEVDDYYKENELQFQTPEQVRLAYIEVAEESLFDQIRVDEDEALSIYQEQPERFMTSELRKARHILIRVPEQAAGNPAEWDRAREQANEYIRQLEAGTSFEKIARLYSQDTLSAGKGGDIGFIAPGDLASDALERALFRLDVEGYSRPIRTDQGFQIVQLVEVQESEQQPFAEVRENIVNERKGKLAQARFIEIADELANLVVEQPDDLTEAAETFGLEIQETGWLTSSVTTGIFANSRVRLTAFTPEILEEGLNSELMEIADGHVLAFRVLEHKVPELKPREDVAGQIRERLRARKSAVQADEAGKEMYAQLQSGISLQELSEKNTLKQVRHGALHRDDDRVPGKIMDLAFTMARPEAGGVSVGGVALDDGSFALLELHSVTDGQEALDETVALQLSQRVNYGRREFSAVLQSIKEDFDVRIFENNL
ncbi:MAG: SurA N-terminal domain-containing protein [Gammaproteobacteria bacterium]|nr:SurA N-terminal domain-containing protein [Gammaproteobacteria bacterium]